jgi:hypothetical protein
MLPPKKTVQTTTPSHFVLERFELPVVALERLFVVVVRLKLLIDAEIYAKVVQVRYRDLTLRPEK